MENASCGQQLDSEHVKLTDDGYVVEERGGSSGGGGDGMPIAPTDAKYVASGKNWSKLDWKDVANKPTIPAAQIQSDWNQTDTAKPDFIKNKPDISAGGIADVTDDKTCVRKKGEWVDVTTVIPVQKNADWNATEGVAQILNKPTIPAAQIQSDWSQSDNSKADFIKNKPTIPSGQVQSDWNQEDNTKVDFIRNKPFIEPAGVYIGEIRLLPFRIADLPEGWLICDGYEHYLNSAVGQALNRLSDNFQKDWGMTKTEEKIKAPDLLSGAKRGQFIRSVDGVNEQVGSVEQTTITAGDVQLPNIGMIPAVYVGNY